MDLKKKDIWRTVTLVDFDGATNQWNARCEDRKCPNTGEFARSDGGTPVDHDVVWMTAVLHEQLFHDGDGMVDIDALISVRPYPVPNPSYKAASRA